MGWAGSPIFSGFIQHSSTRFFQQNKNYLIYTEFTVLQPFILYPVGKPELQKLSPAHRWDLPSQLGSAAAFLHPHGLHSAPLCATPPATLPSVCFVFIKEMAVETCGLESVAWGRTADDRCYLWKEGQGIHYYLTLHFVGKRLRLLPEKWSPPWSTMVVLLWAI